MAESSDMLSPGEVARLLGVNAKTVSRWCRDGKLACIVTPGGHRRIPKDAVNALLEVVMPERT